MLMDDGSIEYLTYQKRSQSVRGSKPVCIDFYLRRYSRYADYILYYTEFPAGYFVCNGIDICFLLGQITRLEKRILRRIISVVQR